jgi:hypothetical protein
MPQPFKGGASQPSWSNRSIKERPKLAKHIGIIVAMWATVEVQLGHTIAALLDADAFVGMTIYAELKSEPARLAAMIAIASERLSAEEFKEFEKLLERVRRTGKQRDRISHNIWATADEYPDSLILYDARAWAKFHASARSLNQARVADSRHDEVYDELIASTLEYKEHDFVFTQSAINELYMDLFNWTNELERRRESLKASKTVR